jgi:hypothetical protein
MRPPANLDQFLVMQADLLQRLVEDAEPSDVKAENQRLQDNLPYQVRMTLPGEVLTSRAAINQLLNAPVDAGNQLEDWRRAAQEAISQHQNVSLLPENEARERAEELELQSYLESTVLY